ncbi:GNAT family N-acetyltransferase [Streptomyces sp. TRM 70351]|uniref:GNAT family N-acetyltransferase n=1 Tax=Streptomyces sp. TRM 70351 TaxID=3116552 RepID=UPI002E7C148B|nr:GNAT family N-acetyltransferase [Streptomyces sp. TRM 70351]MEE1926924.1 GNAT family N-acetyltransferase [Streptomyces sp. TRM 70351]
MLIREATEEDWPAIWPFMRGILAAGETYTYDRDAAEDAVRASWMLPLPGRAFVAVDDEGTVLGTSKVSRNHAGGGSHIANGSYMVDPAHSGRGVGRALGAHSLEWAAAAGFRAMQFNAVVETNTHAVALWQSLGFTVVATLPEGFEHPRHGFVGLHIMYRKL